MRTPAVREPGYRRRTHLAEMMKARWSFYRNSAWLLLAAIEVRNANRCVGMVI